MADTLTDIVQSQGRRVSALEDEQSNPDGLTRIVKTYGKFRITAIVGVSKYTFKTCRDTVFIAPWQVYPGVLCDDGMVI